MKLIVLLCFLLAVSAENNVVDKEKWIENANHFVNKVKSFILNYSLKRELYGFSTNPFCTKWGFDQISIAVENLDDFKSCARENLDNLYPEASEPNDAEKLCFFNTEKLFHDAIDQAKIETSLCLRMNCTSSLKEQRYILCDDENDWKAIIKEVADCIYVGQAIETIRHEHEFIDYASKYSSINESCIESGRAEVKAERQKVLKKFQKCKLDMIRNFKNVAPLGKCLSKFDVEKERRTFKREIEKYWPEYLESLILIEQKMLKCRKSDRQLKDRTETKRI